MTVGPLTALALGDAFGFGFEYAPPVFVQANNFPRRGYVQHPGRPGNKPGTYSDDTQMSLALAEALIDEMPWEQPRLAQRFVNAFKRDPRVGYAQRFYDFLVEIQDGEEFLAKIQPDSDKSGGAMRSPILGLLPDLPTLIGHTRLQCALTHNTPAGKAAAVVAALMLHYFHYDLGTKKDLGEFLDGIVPVRNFHWCQWDGRPVGSKGWQSVAAAATAVFKYGSMADILRACVAYTGDVDTVACIALAAASRSIEIEQDLPEILMHDFEGGEYGWSYLEVLDMALLNRFPGATECPPPVDE